MNKRMHELLARKTRPNKTAAGITATLERQRACGTFRGHKSNDVLMLAVYGTLDVFRKKAFGNSIEKSKCPHCNGTGRLGSKLTIHGQRKLKKLKQKQDNNHACTH